MKVFFFTTAVLFISWIIMVLWRKSGIWRKSWEIRRQGGKLLSGRVVPIEGFQQVVACGPNGLLMMVNVKIEETEEVFSGLPVPAEENIKVGTRVFLAVFQEGDRKQVAAVGCIDPDLCWYLPF